MQNTPPLSPPNSFSPSSSASSASIASTVSLASTLSASAPQFQTRLLDAPIDIHSLNISESAESVTQKVPDSLHKARTVTGGAPGGSVDVLDISMGSALISEGPTPTQESFLKHSPAIPVPSPFQTSSPFAPSQSVASSNDSNGAFAPDMDTDHTPNVYINGLPPNFPEEQLLAMTSEFGEVVSVRTFTRHVSDKPSGYGFVLFGSVEAAERCIETLRKYRNLHPSFSKRIHKIPGTAYGSVPSSVSDSNGISLSTLSVSDSTESELTASDSFKARMERLQDRSSTNLYMEGLPLSINEPTLAALVKPFRIMSSRLFQTRLSNPPRIIAFVRLESRTAAEEVIERLHGRMVRGWNDVGCRISVRFADTSEQRELRRMERMGRDDEKSPARLTIAQAALLNLKGTQLQSPMSQLSGFGGISPTLASNLGLAPDIGYNNQRLGAHSPHFDQEFSNPVLRGLGVNRLGTQYDGLNAQAAEFASRDALRMPHNPILDFNDDSGDLRAQIQALGVRTNNAARAQDGFTRVERLLLQAHLQRQQEELAVASAELQSLRGQGPMGFSANSTLTLNGPPPTIGTGRRLGEFLPSLSEEDFHAGAAHRPQQSFGGVRSSALEIKVPPSRRALDSADAKANFTRQRNQTHTAEARAQADAQKGQAQTVHARSTTLPSQYISGDRGSGSTFLNSGTSEGNSLKSANVKNSFDSKKNITYTSSNNRILSGNNSNASSNITNSQRDNIRSQTSQHLFSTKNNAHTRIDTSSSGLLSVSARASPSVSGNEHDSNESGSELSSPALTCSTRTPATLSPSTPFSAFADTFEGSNSAVGPIAAITVGGGAPQKEIGLGIGGGAGKVKINVV